MDRPGVIFAGVLISAMGALIYNLLPLILGTAQDFKGLNQQSAGILGTSFFAGFTLTTITAFFWIRRLSWRIISFSAIPIAASALLTAGMTESYLLMATAIAVAGGAFSVLYGIGTTVLANTSQPARWYGLKIACEAGLGVILLLILPAMVTQYWGFSGLMVAIAAVLVVLSPLLAKLPRDGNKREPLAMVKHDPLLASALRFAIWLALAGVLTYLFCMTMVWAYIERLAHDAGFDAVITGNILSLSLVVAVFGSLVAMVLGDRFGLGITLATAVSLLLVSLALLTNFYSLAVYAVAACLFNFSFGLGLPYMVSVVADIDVDGRFVVLTVPAIGIGVMLAPGMGGMLMSYGGHNALLITGAVSALTALSFSLLALRLGLLHIDSQVANPVG